MRVPQLMSQPHFASSGVSQGSLLGPLLFLVYINDLSTMFESPCLIYADNLKIWRAIHSLDDKHILQAGLGKLMK